MQLDVIEDRCCGYDTHLRGVRVAVRDLPDPPRTTSRWAFQCRWQCHITRDHRGEWTEYTDDADARPPYRTVEDPAKRQRIVEEAGDLMGRLYEKKETT